MKTRNTLVKLMRNGKTGLTLCTDGYILDSSGKKLFVLKKEPIQLIQTMLEDYQELGSIDKPITAPPVVKYTGNHQFTTANLDLSYELLRIIYDYNNVKFPQPELVEVMKLIQDDLSDKCGAWCD